MPREGTMGRIKRKLADNIFQTSSAGSRLNRAGVYFLRLCTHVGRQIQIHQCPQMAAALAYTTILSLVPVIALFVLYFKMAGKLDSMSSSIQGWILQYFVAESAQGIVVYLDQFVENLHTRAIGTIGAVGLMFTAYSLFRTVERSFNQIWGIQKLRPIFARFQMLCTVLVVVPALLFASFYLTGKIQKLSAADVYGNITALMEMIFYAAPFLLSALPLFFLFKFIPNTKVNWRPALVSALVAGLLFETAKTGFNLYVMRVVPVSKVYGSLGLFPIFLLWIYLLWLIILLGVELSNGIQNLRALHEQALLRQASNPLAVAVHEDWGIRIVRSLLKRYVQGQGPVSAQEIGEEIELVTPQVEDHLQLLERAKLLLWVENENQSGYVPSRPLGKISVEEVISVFRRQLGLTEEFSFKKSATLKDLCEED